MSTSKRRAVPDTYAWGLHAQIALELALEKLKGGQCRSARRYAESAVEYLLNLEPASCRAVVCHRDPTLDK